MAKRKSAARRLGRAVARFYVESEGGPGAWRQVTWIERWLVFLRRLLG